MSSTEKLEEFREFILKPIGFHLHNSDGILNTFANQLQIKFENIIGETRRNYGELNAKGEDIDRFFNDMLIKVTASENLIFHESPEGIRYLTSERLIQNSGYIEDVYADAIYTILQEVKKVYKAQIIIFPKKSERETAFPSFNAVNKSAAFIAVDELKKNKFISDCNPNDFYNIFRSVEISAPIIWCGKISHLAYFIRKLVEKEYISNLDKDIWLVTQKCFVNENKTQFTVKQLRHSDTPKSIPSLNKIIELFAPRK